jgi:cytochrome c oxidase cbb3-type subunit 3
MAERDEVREHSFDGIQEYDNDLPRWWVNIFILTAIYSVGYIIFMHMGFRDSDDVILAKQLAALQAKQQADVQTITGEAGSKSPSEILMALTSDATALAEGKKSFEAKCAACHRADAGGLVGPNLTDAHWIHGGELTDIQKVVINGIPEKGMVAWKGLMTPGEINSVVAYIWSLKGTNPANPKAPEGELVGGTNSLDVTPDEAAEEPLADSENEPEADAGQ